MQLQHAFLCDHAGTNAEGKLDVHGAFNDLYAPGATSSGSTSWTPPESPRSPWTGIRMWTPDRPIVRHPGRGSSCRWKTSSFRCLVVTG